VWHQEYEMRIEHDVKPVTYMKTRAAELLRSVDETRRPVVITQSGVPRGVLMDFESYQELRQATLLLRLLAQGEADVREDETVPQQEVFKSLRARLARK
jgi:prevent-host-death family protein